MMATNLLSELPEEIPDEIFATLLQAPGIHIEQIASHGHASPKGFWYDQPTGGWVIVIKGTARLELEDATREMWPVDFIDIPPHKKHRVGWTTPDEPTVWLAVPDRTFDLTLTGLQRSHPHREFTTSVTEGNPPIYNAFVRS